MSKLQDQQLKWLEELGRLVGSSSEAPSTDEAAPTLSAVLSRGAVRAGPAAAGGRSGSGPQVAGPPGSPDDSGLPKKAKVTSPPTKGLTVNEVMSLVDTLVFLANPKFQRPPGPPKLSPLNPQPAVDGVLEQTAEVIRLWSVPKTLPRAVENWRRVEPRLKSLFAQAETDALVDGSALTPARKAVAEIADYLSIQEVDRKLQQAVDDTPTAELSQAFDEREIKKFEPALRGFRETLKKGGKVADGAEAKKLAQVLDIYFSTPEPMKKLAAFQAAGMLKKSDTLNELLPFILHNLSMGVSSIAESAVHAAKAAGQLGAAKDIGKWAHGAARALGGAVGAYEVYKGITKLISGIEEGNWHEISEGAAEVGMGAIGIGEAVGVITAEGLAAMGTAGVVVVWAVVDVVLSAAELATWSRQIMEQTAFRKFATAMRKLVPLGKRMAAAVELMMEAQSNQDELSANNYLRYESTATDLQAKLVKQLDAIVDTHIHTNDKSYIGGYPALIAPLARAMDNASRHLVPGSPQSFVSAFEEIVIAIRAMLATEAASNTVE